MTLAGVKVIRTVLPLAKHSEEGRWSVINTAIMVTAAILVMTESISMLVKVSDIWILAGFIPACLTGMYEEIKNAGQNALTFVPDPDIDYVLEYVRKTAEANISGKAGHIE